MVGTITTNVIDVEDARGRQFFDKIPYHLNPYALEHVKWRKLWSNDSLDAAANLAEQWDGDFKSLAAAIRSFKHEV